MALPAVVEKLDGVAQADRAHYKKAEDGRFVLDVTDLPEGWVFEDISELKGTPGKLRAEKKKLEEQLQSFLDDDGKPLDVKAARDAMQRVAALGDLTKDTDKRLSTLKDEIEKKYSGELKKLQAERDAAVGELDASLKDTAILAAIAEHKGKSPRALLQIVKAHVKVEVENGKRVARVYRDEKPVLSPKKGSSDPASVSEFVAMLRDEAETASLFEGSSAAGSGGGGTGGPNRGSNSIDPNLPPQERLRLAHQQGAKT